MRTVRAIRYLTPLREGGSVPAIVEADDDGTYVVKFRGAAQGPRALVAELICGELGRLLGLPVPQLALIELDARLALSEPDEEIQELLRKSAGLNLALDYLPGALNWEPALAPPLDPALAAAVVWFDAFITNVDRTVRNPNLLRWHRQLYLIDHGAALYFHHDWTDHLARSRAPFARIRDHVLLPRAGDLRAADAALAPRITEAALREIVAQVPDDWLAGEATPSTWRRGRRPRARSSRRRSVASAFDYAVIRVVPRVERGELVNAGVIVSCPTQAYLAARVALDRARLSALSPSADADDIAAALALIPLIAAGDPRGGPIASLPRGERFHWLVAPRSAVIQTSPVHTGLCDQPGAALDQLLERLVLPMR